ncbi:MAG: hypothetical protein EOM14_07140 [Clostridia bacterium]|nr:hypothetical protein [Clostridia bacterium]
MWELYDALIAGIPEDITVEEVIAGYYWAYVRSSNSSAGISASGRDFFRPFTDAKCMLGQPLKAVAEKIKSWNLVEASIGLAAINSYYNSPETAEKNGVRLKSNCFEDDRMNDPYIAYQNMANGKKVAAVGHASFTVALMSPFCDFKIIGDGRKNSYPMEAAEFLLPEQDIVFLPCIAVATKQIVRWLELTKNKTVIICGPSVPMAPVLFDFGVYDLSGFIIHSHELQRAAHMASSAENEFLFSIGEKVSLKAY